jgi:hypothetical protein
MAPTQWLRTRISCDDCKCPQTSIMDAAVTSANIAHAHRNDSCPEQRCEALEDVMCTAHCVHCYENAALAYAYISQSEYARAREVESSAPSAGTAKRLRGPKSRTAIAGRMRSPGAMVGVRKLPPHAHAPLRGRVAVRPACKAWSTHTSC